MNNDPISRFDLDGLWWTMLVFGILIILFFGFCVCIEPASPKAGGGAWFSGSLRLMAPTESAHCAAHWRSWEIGAVIWSILFGFYYFGRFPMPVGAAVGAAKAIKIISLLIFMATILPVFAALLVLLFKPALWHVGAVIFGGALFMLADCLLYKRLCKEINFASAAEKFKHERETRLYLESIIVADIPMLAGLFTLLLYLLVHQGQPGSRDMESFAGGAISFQLIATNVIFVLSQGGFIRWVWESHMPPEPQGIRIEPTNMWVGPALMCGLFGLAMPFLRLFVASKNPWIGRVNFILLAAAIVAGSLGYVKAGKPGGPTGKGSAKAALAFGLLGLMFLLVLTPSSSVFAAEKLKVLPTPQGCANVKAVALSPDGSMLACGSDQNVSLIDTKTGKPIPGRSFNHDSTVSAIGFSPNGGRLAIGGNSVALWNAETGEREREIKTYSNSGINCFAFSPDGEILAGGSDGKIYLWNAKTGKSLGKGKEENHDTASLNLEDAVRSVRAIAFSADGRSLAAGGTGKSILLWRITTRWLVSEEKSDAEGGDNREISDLEIEETLKFGHFGGEVDSLALSRDGAVLAAGLHNGWVMIWDQMDDIRKRNKPNEKQLGGEPVLALLFSDDARILATATASPGVTLVETQPRGKCRRLGAAKEASVIGFSLDGSAIASGNSVDGTLNVWRSQ